MAKGKVIKWVAAIVAAVSVGLICIYIFGIDAILRSRIEAAATQSLKVKTSLQGASLSLLHGTLGLRGLEIESPEGFGSPVILSVGGANTAVSYSGIRGDPIKVDQIVITKPSLVIEMDLSTRRLNLQALADKLDKSDSSEPTRLVINNLRIEDAQVVLWPGIPGLPTDDKVIQLPTIEVKNIGSGPGAENGAALKDVALQVMTAMAAKAADSDKLPAQARQLLALRTADISKKLGEQFDKQMQGLSESLQQKIGEKLPGDLGKNVGKDVGKAVEGGLQDLTNSLGGKKPPATQPGKGGS